jgi:hypothetical protein
MTKSFLVSLTLTPTRPAADKILKAGTAFLEAMGEVSQSDVGTFRRGKGKKMEVCRLVALSLEGAGGADAASLATTLEVTMRATLLAAVGAGQGDVRVYTPEAAESEVQS